MDQTPVYLGTLLPILFEDYFKKQHQREYGGTTEYDDI